jgi:hypothetical protein
MYEAVDNVCVWGGGAQYLKLGVPNLSLCYLFH